jgi:hypothetical protein
MGTGGCSEILKQKSQKFFSFLSENIREQSLDGDIKDLSERIKLKVFINQVNKECSFNIKLYNISNKQKYPLNEISTCSFVDDTTIVLDNIIIMRYYFEKEQRILVEITKEESGNKKKYDFNTTLGCIMGSRKNTLERKSSSSENILQLKIEKLEPIDDIIIVKFDLSSNKEVKFNEINVKMYYEVHSDCLLYRSECLSDDGEFDPVRIPLDLFKNREITIKFYNNKKKEIEKYTLRIYDFVNEKTFNIKVGGIPLTIVSKSKVTKNYTFIDYLKAGVQIGLSIAIDFTGSNGKPYYPTSLHYINPSKPNQYEKAIYSCGHIIAYYDYDQLFPCFGFGAKINNESCPIFNLNFKEDPNIQYIEGIIENYHMALKKVELYGPTFFKPIIHKMNKLIQKENNIFKYHILMILTDGKIDDLDNTINELVKSSFLPLSIIIIGIGKADFSSMVELDADENPLIDSKGVKAARDLVQFVPFLKYESDPELLANEVLAEIPRQILEYYEQKNLDPAKLVS